MFKISFKKITILLYRGRSFLIRKIKIVYTHTHKGELHTSTVIIFLFYFRTPDNTIFLPMSSFISSSSFFGSLYNFYEFAIS